VRVFRQEKLTLCFRAMIQIKDSRGRPSHLYTMSFSFQTGPLSEAGVAEALPLVRATWPR
jgi:hypothetical protein